MLSQAGTNGFTCKIFWNSGKERVNVHYLNSSFMGKSAAIDVLEHFNFCVECIEKKKIYKFSLTDRINLSFLKILDEHRRDAELNPLIDTVLLRLNAPILLNAPSNKRLPFFEIFKINAPSNKRLIEVIRYWHLWVAHRT